MNNFERLVGTVPDEAVARELVLLLTARGIDCLYRGTDEGWVVEVAAGQQLRAKREIELYNSETGAVHGWLLDPADLFEELSLPGISYLVLWGALLGLIFRLSLENGSIIDAAVFDAGRVQSGEWYRTVTAVFLHSDGAHLAGNLLWGGVYGAVAAGRFGAGAATAAGLLAAVVANLLHLFYSPASFQSLGASNLVFGLLGLVTAGAGAGRSWRSRGVVLVSGLVLLALFGGSPGSDVPGHLSGFAVGMVTGAVMARFEPPGRVAGVVCGGLALAAAGLAWRFVFL